MSERHDPEWEWETSVVVVRRAGREVLLVRQSYGHGFFGLPGGMVEQGETPSAAATRELWEETGLIAEGVRFRQTYDLVYPGSGARYGAHVYDCLRADGPVETRLPDEIADVRWWPLDALPGPLAPSAEAALRDVAMGR